MTEEELTKQNRATIRKAYLASTPAYSYAQLEAVFDKWMIMPDRGILKLLVSFYCANKLPGKALWMIIIGPSGGGKTEFLNSLLLMPDIYPLSTLTPNTFLSGMPGKGDNSLLPKLTGKILMLKDWTSILSMQKDAKSEVMGQFREIYDGSMKKVYGNGRIANWEGKVSVLAASTQAVDLNQQQYTHLGERFLNYRIKMPERKEVAMKSLTNESLQGQMEEELQNAMYLFFKGLDFDKMATETFKLDQKYYKQIVSLSNFATLARSGIIRDFGFKKEVIFVPTAEMPTRITGQLAKIAAGMMMANGGDLTEDDIKIIYKTCLDSIPQTNKMVIIEMAKADSQTTAEIATALGYPTEPIKMYLENLAMLHVCYRIKEGTGYKWTMEPEFSEIIRHYEGIKVLSKEELEDRKEVSDLDVFDDVDIDLSDDEGFPTN